MHTLYMFSEFPSLAAMEQVEAKASAKKGMLEAMKNWLR